MMIWIRDYLKCNIESINEDTFKEFRNIQILYLNSNKLTSCKFLRQLDSLTNLYFCSNVLEYLDGLEGLSNLKELYLTYIKKKNNLNHWLIYNFLD